MKKNNSKINVYWIYIIILFAFTSCLEEEGKDKYPDIPEFPNTTNSNMSVKKIFEINGSLFFNDSYLIFFSQDTMTTYNIEKKTTSKKIGCYLDFYRNGLFLCHNENGYFTIDDENFKIINIEQFNEYQKYNSITDSLRNESIALNSEVDQSVLDSTYIKYFWKKYKLNKEFIPIIKYMGNNNFYIQSENRNFILSNTPNCLSQVLSEIQDKKALKDHKENKIAVEKFNYHDYYSGSYSNKENYFKNYDYSMMSKFWTSTGGGNHYVPSIPYMDESGFYYFEFDIDNNKGKFKIHSDKNSFRDLTKLSNNQFITIFSSSIYEITLNN